MARKKVDKEQIISKAYQIFRVNGYHKASMADIGKACGLLKGSIYHYFSSKEDLMLHVLIKDHELMKINLCSLAYAEQLTCKERLSQMMQVLENCYFNAPGGCIMANIGLEAAQSVPEFKQVIINFFEDWIATFSFIFQSQYDKSKAQTMAEQAVQEIEGAIMLSVLFQDKKYFLSTSAKIQSYID